METTGFEGFEITWKADVYADAPQVLEENRRALSGEEFTSVIQLGSVIFEARYSPMWGPDGEITGAIGVAVDITARRRAEEAQSQAVSLLRATLESTADGILVVDGAGHISTYNRKFAEMWNIPLDVLDSADDDRAIGHVLSQLRNPEAFVERVRLLYENPGAESFDVLHTHSSTDS